MEVLTNTFNRLKIELLNYLIVRHTKIIVLQYSENGSIFRQNSIFQFLIWEYINYFDQIEKSTGFKGNL